MTTGARRLLPALLLALAAGVPQPGCAPPPTPKPRGYFRIALPNPTYAPYASPTMPYSFERAEASRVEKDRERDARDTWTNIVYPGLNCKIHLTFLSLPPGGQSQALEDSHQFAYKHSVMADAIGEHYYESPERRVFATLYEIKGNAASPVQFAITDSATRFLRGSLYFYCHPNKDSLTPVVNHVRKDIDHLIETFKWTTTNAADKEERGR